MATHLIDPPVVAVLYVIIGLPSESEGTISAVAFFTALVWISVAQPGKRAFGLRVLKPDDSSVGLGRKFCRILAWMTLGEVGWLIIAFPKDKLGLQDLICDTVVFRL